MLARAAEGVDIAAADSAFKAVAADFPQVDSFNNQEFRDDQQAQLDQLLVIIYAMLALAIIIALFGIIITLALAVFERTREIGLLRAIGMARRQVARMIRWESVLVAVLGGLVGVVIGTVLGMGDHQQAGGLRPGAVDPRGSRWGSSSCSARWSASSRRSSRPGARRG